MNQTAKPTKSASAAATTSTRRPRSSVMGSRTDLLFGPVLDIALQHAVLEVLLLEHRLGDVAEVNHPEQLFAVHHRKVARAEINHGALQFFLFLEATCYPRTSLTTYTDSSLLL